MYLKPIHRPGGMKVMRHFYEMYMSCGGNWQHSSVMLNIRNRSKGKKTGKYVWKKWETLAKERLGCAGTVLYFITLKDTIKIQAI